VLVIGVGSTQPASAEFSWSGRRHDDDASGASRGTSSEELFDAVFHALHDGEQVAVGVAATLSAPLSGDLADDDAALNLLTGAEAKSSDTAAIRTLLDEIGQWRPWTVVSTSLARWRATTSVLVFEIDADAGDTGVVDAAVDAFFEQVRSGSDTAAPGRNGVLNLPAAMALRAGLDVDTDQLTEAPLSIAP
jgi:hypothetical protein